MAKLTITQEKALVALIEDPTAKVNAQTRAALAKRGLVDHNGATEQGRNQMRESPIVTATAVAPRKRRGVYPFRYPAKPRYAKATN